MSWDDLHAVIFAAPPGTAVFHAVERGWSTTDYLLANAIDALLVANWQRTEDATKKQPVNFPARFPRPGGVSDDNNEAARRRSEGVVSVAGAPATVTTVGKFLELRAQREREWLEKHNHGNGGEVGAGDLLADDPA